MYKRMDQNLVDKDQYYYKQQDPQYRGEPLDSDLADGPSQNRRCRDVFCCLLYFAFWAGMIIIAIFAFSKGNPQILAAPFDYTGKQCGHSQGYENFPYAYFNMYNISQFACIQQCPKNTTAAANIRCIANSTQFNCSKYGQYQTLQLVSVCFPTLDEISSKINLGLDFFQEGLNDLKYTWPISLSVGFMALIVSIIMLFIVQLMGGCIVYFTILLYFIILTVFSIVSFLYGIGKLNIQNIDYKNPELFKAIAYICWGILGISIIAVICYCRKIKISVMVIKAAAQFTRERFYVIIIPILMFIVIGIFFTWWILVSVYIFSSGTVGQCHGSPYACIEWDVGVKRCLVYYFFGLFWNCEVAIGICHFVLASIASMWYFSRNNAYQQSNPISKSLFRAFVFSFGSIVFGALILTILVMLQIIFQLLHNYGKKHTISGDPVSNAVAQCCINYIRCCLACFERFIRFITKNAYIMMAISGEGFCTSAHQSFYLAIRCAFQYALTNGVGQVIMVFAKLLITVICTIIGYLMIVNIQYFDDKLFSPFMPTMIFAVISYVIATLFMDVFGVTADTILMCYSLQLDIHKGRSKACPDQVKGYLQSTIQ